MQRSPINHPGALSGGWAGDNSGSEELEQIFLHFGRQGRLPFLVA